VGQARALELGDALIDDRVPAVVCLELEEVASLLVTNAWWPRVVNSASWLPGVGRTLRMISRTISRTLTASFFAPPLNAV
jgi:hypothetical protein